MKIDGIAIAGFRSFGDQLVEINDLQKINVFIGKNNSGKSNILRFIKHVSEMKIQEPYKGFNQELDYSVDSKTKDIQFGFQIKKGPSATSHLYDQVSSQFTKWDDHFPEWKKSFWFVYSTRHLNRTVEGQPFAKTLGDHIFKACPPDETNRITGKLCGYTQGSPEKRAQDIAVKLLQMTQIPFTAYLIDAFRQITHGEDDAGLSGRGLIKKLRSLQSPDLNNYQASKLKFSKINEFVQELLGEPDAFLEIPAEQDDIYVSIKDKILPLHSLGTGIHELIILAASVTVYDNVVFCIEEPEIHLHPGLQKKFIKYIKDKTNNQYFITTHSNSFFDLEDVNIYHCRLIGRHTKCNLVTTHLQKSSILSDLGFKASDILQSNYVVWVEGPSDRTYLNHWIKSKNPSLIEGLHYSIMFYGGRLLSHLAFNDPEVSEFIQLCKLNRNACIMIDSDKKTAHTWLNDTKKRIIKDFNTNGAFAWVTNGRTIENYIPEKIFNDAIEVVHPKTKKFFKWDRFNDLTKLRKDKTIDKVGIAKKVSLCPADFSMLDLEKQISDLVQKIENANK
ncbi:MAG: AAA family ATPase [Desulfuromonadales bacterium]|nr:AAA family ATPase [Desulfuromonadales bacterium]MBN2791942.1 AAA family ATPase [Desulfuromonadales bacterium]